MEIITPRFKADCPRFLEWGSTRLVLSTPPCAHWCPPWSQIHPSQPIAHKSELKAMVQSTSLDCRSATLVCPVHISWPVTASAFSMLPFMQLHSRQAINPLMRWGRIMRKKKGDMRCHLDILKRNIKDPCPINEGQLNGEASRTFLLLLRTLGITIS